jgi:hypothetical protein
VCAIVILSACLPPILTPTPPAITRTRTPIAQALPSFTCNCWPKDKPTPQPCERPAAGQTIQCTVKQTTASGKVVTVTVPWQGNAISIENLNLDPNEKVPSSPDFTVIRQVINFEARNLDKSILKVFNPKMSIRVDYTAVDVEKVGGDPSRLRLGFWDGNRWVAFTKAKHDYQLTGDKTGGFASVSVATWDDRPIAWDGSD